MLNFYAGILSNPSNYFINHFDLQMIDNELSDLRETASLSENDNVKALLEKTLEKTGKRLHNPGYIIAGNRLHIYDPEKAFQYAYNVGKNNDVFSTSLLGSGTPRSVDKGRSRYNAYTLYVYALIGQAANTINEPGELESLKENLVFTKDAFADPNFIAMTLTDDQIFEIINKYGN